MKISPTPRYAPVLLLVFALTAVPAVSAGAGKEKATFQSATVCARCHPEIYRTWRNSQHASSFTDPAFQLPFDRIRREKPGQVLPCEQCHNPMRYYLSPDDPRAAVFAKEGVTCDFCHSVESVDPEGGFPRFRLVPGIKFGPYPTAKESAKGIHEIRFSSLHITSRICAGCHEFRNEYGVPILSTYSEWEESFYRGQSVHCQFCHLPELFDARFIDPVRKKGPISHEMVGGRSPERLEKAIQVRASLSVRGREARAEIQLKNETSGHKVPTGIPTRRLRLKTTLYDEAGNPLGERQEVFERVVGDGAGNPLRKPERIFTVAREVLRDNRIGPKETREVVHVFPLDGKNPRSAEISLTYEIDTPDIAPQPGSINIPISRVIVPARTGIPMRQAMLIALVAALLILAAGIALRRRLS